ncbi:hypothetical protein FOA52_010718 [Chlamydomonas sp. UWO 241]|nr:hypothetical protein FOA52_010718 [Chlamydomonas sp. UWO 241]
MISIWHGDFSAVIAVIGLVAVYIGSAEMLALFGCLAPFSLVIDIIWMAVDYEHHHQAHGWLIFFTVLDMVAKVVGSVFAWSLYSSGSSEAAYAPVGSSPPSDWAPAGGGFAPHADPFASAPGFGGYAPPPSAAAPGFGASLPTSQAPAHTLV